MNGIVTLIDQNNISCSIRELRIGVFEFLGVGIMSMIHEPRPDVYLTLLRTLSSG